MIRVYFSTRPLRWRHSEWHQRQAAFRYHADRIRQELRVIVRRWSNGDLIAMFPEEPASTVSWFNCESYMEVGGHGAADVQTVTRNTKPASLGDVATMFELLRRLGYQHLLCVSRESQRMRDARQHRWRVARYGSPGRNFERR